ncbi:MAG: GAF domain-containing protein [Pleurocapsa minor HA4230-MV1]|jgi:signal transduction histidine kinase/ActR/RegA family two-component response regulator|nr:GAF domain-containing protein [Pleurocapsa minor HA4230-MV1]
MTESLPQKPATPIPANETERLAALYRYKILDTSPEAAFDRITRLASQIFNMPIALISLVDESRAWFKSCIGFAASEVSRNATLCSFAVLTDEPLIVPDARLDERFACNPFVKTDPGIRFYAGAPLLSHDGFNLGTLCLLDSKPHDPLSAEQQATLVDLAAMVVDELELRLAATKIAQVDAALIEITQGVATVTGGEFLDALVRHFAKVLDVDYVYIGLVEGEDPKMMRTIATCAHGQIVENLEYLLQDTPCWQAIEQRKICCYPRNVQTRFPTAPLLKPLCVESYVAIPFFDSSGTVLGLLGIMDGDPLENVQLTESLLTIFASRIATELERETLLRRKRHYLKQLQGLATAAVAINSARRVEELLQAITYQAAEIVGAHQSITSMTTDHNSVREISRRDCVAINSVYLSDKYEQWRNGEQSSRASINAYVCHLNRPLRMTQAELKAHSCWQEFSTEADKHPPMRGLLAAPLFKRDGQNIGLIRLSDKYEGEFTETDESIIVQLASLASIAIENTRLYEAQQQARSTAETAREAAQSANRIKDEFLAVLSHELRSPLNPILGWSKLLQQGKLDPTQTQAALATIERNAQLQTQLIDDLLDISRILRGKLSLNQTPVDLKKVISSALETVCLAAEAKSLQIETVLPSDVGTVMGDAGRLQQIVGNLLSNAVKFTNQGGQIRVALTQIGTHAQIQVMDTGKGINPDFLPYVFEHFRQEDGATTRKFGGLGLGLAIARQIVEMHGGQIGVDSSGEGQGATFTVKLPLAQTLSQLPSTESSDTSTNDLNGIRILVVDDEPDSRDFTALVLELSGASVTSVASGIEALTMIKQSIPDLIISDIGMPEMDGYMLLQQVRTIEQVRQVSAIALTAYAGEFNRQQALQAGFQKHLSKPIEPNKLIQAISDLVGGEQP